MDTNARVADVMRREVEFISPEASVQEAAQLMGELDVGALPVGTREEMRGIVTDRDILLRVVAQGLDPAQARVSEAMSSMLFSCREDDTLQTALDLMVKHDVRRLPVVDSQERVTGWVTLAHVWQKLMQEGQAVPAQLTEMAALPQ